MSSPAAACRTKRVMPTTEACARCAEPKASQTKTPSQRAASCLEKASSFLSSSGWKRTFSSTSTSPSRNALLCASAPGPMQSKAKAAGLPRSSSSFLAAGFSEYFASGPPLGRPRWEARIRRPPFAMARRSVGSVSRMRVSSVTTASFSGTLKSTRMKTRLPLRSRSLMVSLDMKSVFSNWFWVCRKEELRSLSNLLRCRSKLGCQKLNQVAATAGVAPLVVEPSQNLDAAIADHFGVLGVDNGRVGIAFEVGGDQFFLGVAENALHGAICGSFQSRVDRILGRGLVDEDGQVHHAHVGRGHTHGVAVELAFQLRDNEMQCFRGTGGTGNQVQGSGARATQILVRQIKQPLIVGVGMDGGHCAAIDAESVLKNFGDGREAIRGAGGVGNDVMLRGVVALVVDPKNEGGVGAVRGRRDNDLFHGGAEMLLRVRAFGKEAGGLHDDFRADGSPIEFGGILDAEHREATTVYRDAVVGMSHFVRQIAEHRIVFQQVRECFSVGDVVDGNELNILVVDGGAQDVATDAAEAVNANFDGHTFLRSGNGDF